MPVAVHDDDKVYELQVEVDVDGHLYIKAYAGDVHVSELPRMTPFEAGMLARELTKAAEKADKR
jgi:hypothetical protein